MEDRRSANMKVLCLGAVGLGAIILTIADRQRFFEKHGADVQLTSVTGTQIPDLSDATPMGYIGAPAALMRAAAGKDIKILASFDSARLTSSLVVSPGIHNAQDLKGRRLGARVTGAAMWLHTVLALEKLKLDPLRDEVEIAEIGDPAQVIVALQRGLIDGAVLSQAQCKQLKAEGFRILLDFTVLNVHGAPDALVVQSNLLQEQRQAEAVLAAMIEAAAFVTSDRNKEPALLAVKSTLGLSDDSAVEGGLCELVRTLARKPYPSIKRLQNMQRMMAKAKPDVLSLSIETVVDDRLVRKLDTTGYIDQIYTEHAA
jgi:ABC-type nitrate/sulfonate/bicarbonate transport system substrate-binding protein